MYLIFALIFIINKGVKVDYIKSMLCIWCCKDLPHKVIKLAMFGEGARH